MPQFVSQFSGMFQSSSHSELRKQRLRLHSLQHCKGCSGPLRRARLQFSQTLVKGNVLQRYALHLHRFNISDRFIKPGNKFGVRTARAPNRTANDEVISRTQREHPNCCCRCYAVLRKETQLFVVEALTNCPLIDSKRTESSGMDRCQLRNLFVFWAKKFLAEEQFGVVGYTYML